MVTLRLTRFVVPGATVVVVAAVAMALASRPHANAQVSNDPEPSHGVTERVFTQEEVAPPLPGVPIPVLRNVAFGQMTAEVNGQFVVVKGEASVSESVAGNAYQWLLRVYDAGGKKALFKEQHYPDGAVVVQEPGDIHPEFSDVITLPPGKYRIELTVYAVPQGFAVNKLPFGADMRNAAIIKLSRSEKVEVAN